MVASSKEWHVLPKAFPRRLLAKKRVPEPQYQWWFLWWIFTSVKLECVCKGMILAAG